MDTICGADCGKCQFACDCRGCRETGGRPFGGACVAAEYIRVGGREAYEAFKTGLLEETNRLLALNGLPPAEALYELPGKFLNLPYTLPGGETVRFLDDRKIYLGAQIEFADQGVCFGVAADTGFILICRYSRNGSEPELIAYQKR